MSFTRAQQKHYRTMVRRAWERHASDSGIPYNNKVEKDRWYRSQLLECIGVDTTAGCDQAQDFDAVMLHFSLLAADDWWIDRLSRGDETRMTFQIGRRLETLSCFAGKKCNWEYARSIFEHMHLPLTIDNCPALMLRKVLVALDTHIRRVKKKQSLPF